MVLDYFYLVVVNGNLQKELDKLVESLRKIRHKHRLAKDAPHEIRSFSGKPFVP